MPQSAKTLKDESRSKLLRAHGYGLKSRAVILLDVASSDIREFLLSAGKHLDIAFLIADGSEDEKGDYAGFDAFISDVSSDKLDLIKLIQSGVVPILPASNSISTSLSEFDPMKFTGNAFLFEQVDIYHIFEKLIRYLENIRYAGDRRTLMENLKKTF